MKIGGDIFAENLKELMSKRALKGTELAEAMGVSNNAVTQWRKGTLPHTDTLKSLAVYFGVSLNDLIGDGEGTKYVEEPKETYGSGRVINELEARVSLQSEFIASLKGQVEQLTAQNRRLGQMYDYLVRQSGVGQEAATAS